jgi:hypothetical protein
MLKRQRNLAVDCTCDMIELSEEENNFSEISSESEEEIVSLDSVAGTSVTTSTAISELQSESSESDKSDSESDVADVNCYTSGKTDWVQNGRRRDRFPRKYDAGSKGELRNKTNPLDIYEYFFSDDICEHI